VPAIPTPLPSSVSVSVRPEGNRPAADLFARGVVAFRAGRYGEAETHWKLFLANFPGDPRNEDVSFLRAVGRSRAGDKTSAAALAREYLLRFPTGMRRREAEALSSLSLPSARH
jgi:outer membrane protein assembly factor BamD (BamD/ComL family)